MATSRTPVTCPRCGAAIGGTAERCASCLAEIVDPGERFDRWSRIGLIALCIGLAVRLAGSVVLHWLHGAR